MEGLLKQPQKVSLNRHCAFDLILSPIQVFHSINVDKHLIQVEATKKFLAKEAEF